MTAIRRAVAARAPAATAASVGLLATAVLLGGCGTSAPQVTVQSGTSSAVRAAECWAKPADGTVDAASCQPTAGAAGQVAVRPEEAIVITVDTAVATHGWYPLIDGQRLVAAPIRATTYRTALPATQLRSVRLLTVTALAANGTGVRGVWSFLLTPST
jgi:hypothetical protein